LFFDSKGSNTLNSLLNVNLLNESKNTSPVDPTNFNEAFLKVSKQRVEGGEVKAKFTSPNDYVYKFSLKNL
jgi:hypothetical protein